MSISENNIDIDELEITTSDFRDAHLKYEITTSDFRDAHLKSEITTSDFRATHIKSEIIISDFRDIHFKSEIASVKKIIVIGGKTNVFSEFRNVFGLDINDHFMLGFL